ncbi:MAG: hypothetical protein HYU71_11300 [Bacteroidetes bacterium]|nr:hypothetical protein [Bacteroidota bacterium]
MCKLGVLLFCTGFFLAGTVGYAQSVRVDQVFGLGITGANISGKAGLITDSSAINADYSVKVHQFGIVYGARVNIVTWRFGSVSIGSPIMLGLSTTGNYRSVDFNGTKRDTIVGLRGTRLALELPLFADLNIGLSSAADDSRNKNFGIYIGAGYMYSYTRLRTSVGNVIFDGFDPCVRAGIRIGSSWERRYSVGFTMRGNLSNNGSPRTYGIQLLKEL